MARRDDEPVAPTSTTSGPVRSSSDLSSSDLIGLFAQLRAAITAYVHQLRSEGLRPEEVVPAVQRLVQQAESEEHSPDELGVLMSQVVRWSLEAYDGAPEPRTAPRLS